MLTALPFTAKRLSVQSRDALRPCLCRHKGTFLRLRGHTSFLKSWLVQAFLSEIVMWDLLVDVYGRVMEYPWMEGLASDSPAFMVPGHFFICLRKNPVKPDLLSVSNEIEFLSILCHSDIIHIIVLGIFVVVPLVSFSVLNYCLVNFKKNKF